PRYTPLPLPPPPAATMYCTPLPAEPDAPLLPPLWPATTIGTSVMPGGGVCTRAGATTVSRRQVEVSFISVINQGAPVRHRVAARPTHVGLRAQELVELGGAADALVARQLRWGEVRATN